MRRALVTAAVLCTWPAAGCGQPVSADSLDGATRAMAPHRERFMRFDEWARRAQATARVTPNGQALDEATFAPLRNASAVLGAWVELPGEHSQTLAMPARAPLPEVDDWVPLRDEELGVLLVAPRTSCPVSLPSWWRQGRGEGPCVIAARSQPIGLDGELVVTMAFAPPD